MPVVPQKSILSAIGTEAQHRDRLASELDQRARDAEAARAEMEERLRTAEAHSSLAMSQASQLRELLACEERHALRCKAQLADLEAEVVAVKAEASRLASAQEEAREAKSEARQYQAALVDAELEVCQAQLKAGENAQETARLRDQAKSVPEVRSTRGLWRLHPVMRKRCTS